MSHTQKSHTIAWLQCLDVCLSCVAESVNIRVTLSCKSVIVVNLKQGRMTVNQLWRSWLEVGLASFPRQEPSVLQVYGGSEALELYLGCIVFMIIFLKLIFLSILLGPSLKHKTGLTPITDEVWRTMRDFLLIPWTAREFWKHLKVL